MVHFQLVDGSAYRANPDPSCSLALTTGPAGRVTSAFAVHGSPGAPPRQRALPPRSSSRATSTSARRRQREHQQVPAEHRVRPLAALPLGRDSNPTCLPLRRMARAQSAPPLPTPPQSPSPPLANEPLRRAPAGSKRCREHPLRRVGPPARRAADRPHLSLSNRRQQLPHHPERKPARSAARRPLPTLAFFERPRRRRRHLLRGQLRQLALQLPRPRRLAPHRSERPQRLHRGRAERLRGAVPAPAPYRRRARRSSPHRAWQSGEVALPAPSLLQPRAAPRDTSRPAPSASRTEPASRASIEIRPSC